MRRNQRTLAAATAIALLPSALLAQLGSFNPAPGPHGTYAITHAHIFPVSGPEIPNGTLVIGADGKISAVGANVSVPSGAKVIDGTGLRVYPGMMESNSELGLTEIPEGAAATVDATEVGSFNPNAKAFYAINPHSAHIGVARVVGITHAISTPSGGVIAGTAALINLAGWTAPDMAVVRQIALTVTLPGAGGGRGGGGGGGRGGAAAGNTQQELDSLKALLKNAEAYGKMIDAYAKDKTLPRPKHDVVLESLVPVVRGEERVMFNAQRAADIRAAVTFAEENHLKPIIVGARDAVEVADFLKQHNVPVILTTIRVLPAREDDPYDLNYSQAGKLAAAGVQFAISSGEPPPDMRDLPYVAGMAAAFGLSKENALKSVTLWPAQIFGVGDKLGSLEVGKIANVVVTNGDMLEAKTDTKYLFIDGRPVPLDTKHTVLYNEFKDR